MTDTTMRADFEQHIRDSIVSEVGDSFALKRLENGDYWAMWVADRWVGYQAATERAAKVCENERLEDKTGHESDVGYNMAISHCVAAIRQGGDT